jgi:hypothetical protein
MVTQKNSISLGKRWSNLCQGKNACFRDFFADWKSMLTVFVPFFFFFGVAPPAGSTGAKPAGYKLPVAVDSGVSHLND